MIRQSSSSASRSRKNIERKIENQLDLHGFTKEKAIRRMTQFLEEEKKKKVKQEKYGNAKFNTNSKYKSRDGSKWVEIITGSGKHSQDGPVLREAVRKVLDIREMTYYQRNDAGSFAVNVMSGYDIIAASQPKDSKIVCVSQDSDIAKAGQALQRRNNYHHHPYRGEVNIKSSQNPDYEISKDMDFTPADVKTLDDTIEKVKSLSHTEYMNDNKLKKKELEELQRAVEESEIMNLCTSFKEEDDLQKAIAASRYDDFEISLEEAIKASLAEEQLRSNR